MEKGGETKREAGREGERNADKMRESTVIDRLTCSTALSFSKWLHHECRNFSLYVILMKQLVSFLVPLSPRHTSFYFDSF